MVVGWTGAGMGRDRIVPTGHNLVRSSNIMRVPFWKEAHTAACIDHLKHPTTTIHIAASPKPELRFRKQSFCCIGSSEH